MTELAPRPLNKFALLAFIVGAGALFIAVGMTVTGHSPTRLSTLAVLGAVTCSVARPLVPSLRGAFRAASLSLIVLTLFLLSKHL